METGQLFLMPEKNNSSHTNSLSIHSYKNGFSFCTSESIDFQETISFNEETRHIFESLLHYSPEKQYDDIQWICHDGPCLFIPKPLFSESKLKEYWKFFAPKSSTSKLVYDQNEVQKLILMYEERPLVFDYLKAHAKSVERTHYIKKLFDCILQKLSKYPGNKVYIHLSKDSFDVFVFKGDQFELYNTFELISEETFLYYLFFIVEQMKWNPDEFSMIFMGTFEPFRKYYEATKSYQNAIFFLSPEREHKYSEEHPSPFLVNFLI